LANTSIAIILAGHSWTPVLGKNWKPINIFVLLNGKIIERYPERKRVLVYGKMLNKVPLHVVCNFSDPELLYIVTVYIPSPAEWSANFQKRKERRNTDAEGKNKKTPRVLRHSSPR
jgi:Domain of unknown function (DUF4258)